MSCIPFDARKLGSTDMRNASSTFAADRRGNVAMIFAVSAIPLMTAVGAAVDYSSAGSIQSHLQADTDAAALLACKSPLTAEADLRKLAQGALDGYMPERTVTITSFKATNNPRSVELTSEVIYPPRFVRLGDVRISTASSCAAGENNYEIALVLDTTGSMNQSAGTGTKMEALRSAATNFVNTMFNNFDASHVKMSIVPFAAAVKVDPATYAPNNVPASSAAWIDASGTSPIHWQNVLNPTASGFTSRFDLFRKLKAVQSGWGWAGCMESLPYPYNTQDATPSTATPATRYVPLFAPDEVGNTLTLFGIPLGVDTANTNSVNNYMDDGTAAGGSCDRNNANKTTRLSQACKYTDPKSTRPNEEGPNWGCTSRPITRLTNVKQTLLDEIAALTANGQTNIAEGLHWGWRTVAKTGVFTDAADYGTQNTTKIIILMTDGVNTWNHETRYSNGTSTVNTVTDSEYSAYGYFKSADGTTAANRFPSGTGTPTTSAEARAAMDKLVGETCTNAKAKNVVIYAVAFSTPGDAIDASGQQLIQDCASGSGKYFLASDASSLNATFVAIAQGIGQLRLTR